MILLLTLGFSVAADRDFEARCHREVVALHETIEGWLAGTLPKTEDAYARFRDAMAEDFVIISPRGTLSNRIAIVDSLREAHGVRDRSFKISIRNVRTRLLRPPLALLTYEEWQHDGKNTTARLSSVWLRDDPSAPDGIAWVHLHETWLPDKAPLSAK